MTAWNFVWYCAEPINQFGENWHLLDTVNSDPWTWCISPLTWPLFNFSQQCLCSFQYEGLVHLSSDLSKYLIFRCYYKRQCFYNFHFQVLIVYRYTSDSYILILYSVTLLNSLIVFLHRQFHPIFSSSSSLTALTKSSSNRIK